MTPNIPNSLKYVGKVIDRCTQRVMYKSHPCTTWETAQRKAEIAARRSGYGERVRVVVE